MIDFLVTHLSAGNARSPEFAESRKRFECVWRKRLFVGLLRTTSLPELRVSRIPLVEKLLSCNRIAAAFWRSGVPLVH